MASTPPPPSPTSLRVPRAPRFGPKHDNYEPYPTRSSARLAGQREVKSRQITPPTSHSSAPNKMGVPKRTLSPFSPGTGQSAPRKAANSRISQFDSESSHPHTSASQPSRSSAERALPTPAKTPSKKKIISTESSTSRAIFPPSSTPRRKKVDIAMDPFDDLGTPLTGSTGYTTHVRGQTDPALMRDLGIPSFPIHTDSRDRIPMRAGLGGNPFASKPGRPTTRSTTTHDDGVWYVCRGKKVFKRFDEMEADEDEDEDDLGLLARRPDLFADEPDMLKKVKPLTRSSIKPRTLFKQPEPEKELAEEEDLTDVEDNDAPSPTPADPAYDFAVDTVTPEFEPIDSLVAPGAPGSKIIPTSNNMVPGSNKRVRTDSGASLLNYYPLTKKLSAVETRADRLKRSRESRGSPAPRIRKALRSGTSAEAPTSSEPVADV
ncbi:uncharacterized protein N7511_010691 [Penicillium nucicola]|uniref:uncharacterized protein n=1 Tax=Penicillium nucicola TaxID=1850975 RepID=UPI0025456199|nr:uncharacterized protein N7511_010691 [Penicillium nucicola]KAJ5748995.1 hypothetical protein N7511_010691 [Penicillium nucicola]